MCYSTFSLALIADFVVTHVLVNQQIRDDRVIRNPTTDQCIGGPFQGHTRGVNSVAYPPDGSHIASGSEDKTIRVWNPTIGQSAASPFQSHKATDRFTEAWTPPWARHGFYLPVLSLIISRRQPCKSDSTKFVYGVSCWKSLQLLSLPV